MKFFMPIFLLAASLGAQDIIKKIEVPLIHPDPNVQFTILHYEALSKEQFSVLYYRIIPASVMKSGEYVRDTGQYVYFDQQFKEMIPYSNGVILLKKQVFDVAGKQLSVNDWLLAQRQLPTENVYRMYYGKNHKDPLVENRTKLTQSVYNAGDLQGFTEEEMAEVIKFCKTFIPEKPKSLTAQVEGNAPPNRNQHPQKTIGEDLKSMKNQIQSLRQLGEMRGDLPSNEKIFTRFSYMPNRTFAITRTKGDKEMLKFYISEDDKTHTLLDSASLNGSVDLVTVATLYNLNAEPVGAFANFVYDFKDEKGEKISRQYSFALDAEYKVRGWIHSTGKDKLSSIAPELGWFEGDKLYLMSNNREKFFKPYAQVHEFGKDGKAQLLHPATEADKGTEKTKYVETFQPPVQFGTGVAEPMAEKNIPLRSINIGGTRYFIAEGFKHDAQTKTSEYLSLYIYRFEANGKLTNIDVLGNIRMREPFPFEEIVVNPNNAYYLLPYPIKVQLKFTPEKVELSKMTDDKNNLVQRNDRKFVKTGAPGSLLLMGSGFGNKLTLFFYPKE